MCLLVILIAGHRHQYQAALMHTIINQRTQHAKIVDTESSFSISAVCQDLTPSWPCSHFVNIYKNCCLDYPPASCVEQCSRERTTRVHPLAQTTKRSFNTSLPLWALCAVHGNCGEVATPARTLRGIPKLYSLFIPGSPRTHTRSTLMTHRRTLLNGLCSYIYQLISPEYDNSHHRRQLVWLICLSSRYKKNPPRPRPPPITIFL